MAAKTKFDAKGHEAILEALGEEFDVRPSPRGDYARLLVDGKLAGWLRPSKAHVRIHAGGGAKGASCDAMTVAQAKAFVPKLVKMLPKPAAAPAAEAEPAKAEVAADADGDEKPATPARARSRQSSRNATKVG